MHPPFSADDRPRIRAELERGVEVLIVGGGINGAGLARDLALRGCRVGLVEKDDFAAGTSSKSSRLIHGGLRYLEQGKIGLVFESVTERWRLSHLARHLVRPLRFVFPVHRNSRVPLWKMNLGVTIYDALALFRNYRNHDRLGRKETLEALPALEPTSVTGAVAYYDYRTNDARLTLENVIAAWEAGAFPLSKASALAPTFDARDPGRVAGVTVEDGVGGDRFEIRADVMVSATGPWTDQALRTLSGKSTAQPLLRPTKGIHIVVPSEKLPLPSAAALTHPRDGRVLFALPFGRRSVIGTTDTDWTGPVDDVRVETADVDYLLELANSLFPSSRLAREDVISSWAGLRPLLNQAGARESSVSREEKTIITPERVIAIFGGKLTTYRSMVEELGDLVSEMLEERTGRRLLRAATRDLPLPGAAGLGSDEDLRRLSEYAQHRAGLPRECAWRLAENYGSRVPELLDLARTDSTGRLFQRMVPDLPHIWAEVLWAAHREMALDLEDVMVRRTGIFYEARDQGASIAPEAAAIMAGPLHWSEARQTEEVTRFLAVITEGRRWRETKPAPSRNEKSEKATA